MMPEYLKRYGPRYITGVIFGRKSLKEYSEDVLEETRSYEKTNGPITIIIGYSMGGLIARYAAKRLQNVRKLILVATPNLGIEKRILRKIPFLWRIKCVQDSIEGSEFLKKLNSELPLDCKVFLIAGSNDKFVSLKSALGMDVPTNQKIILPFGHSELIPRIGNYDDNEGAIPKIVQLLKDR